MIKSAKKQSWNLKVLIDQCKEKNSKFVIFFLFAAEILNSVPTKRVDFEHYSLFISVSSNLPF